MSRMNRRSLPLAAGLLGLAAAARAVPVHIPAEGIVLQAGQRLSQGAAPHQVEVTGDLRLTPKLTDWRTLNAKPPRGVLRLERQRRYERKKALRGRQGATLFKGILTEKLFQRGKGKAREKTNKRRQGK